MQSAGNHPQIRRVKILVLGASGVGKTCIIRRFVNNRFEHGRNATIGADFYTRMIQNPLYWNNEIDNCDSGSTACTSEDFNCYVALKDVYDSSCDTIDDAVAHEGKMKSQHSPDVIVQMWDTAGQEKFHGSEALGNNFFQKADGALLVYDGTSNNSFNQLVKWYNNLMARIDERNYNHPEMHGKTFPIVVVANKLDKLRIAATKRMTMTVAQRDVLGLGLKKMSAEDMASNIIALDYSEPSLTDLMHNASTSSVESLSSWADTASYEPEYDYTGTDYESLPNRKAVLQWCQKKGVKHVDTSAYDGSGINLAVDAIVLLALRSINERENMHKPTCKTNYEIKLFRRETIDFHKRYAKDKEKIRCDWGCIIF
mmetsp:Transcript_31585/g.38631  ORF Transcript_31585/g.38631 Transcript_31585/m.38631 type:complete len:370 (-) Transcript_31585:205-1314(-)|eukprot:CAMPEP_0172504218 /NCGR_PEP_ID=MMETSP1066-20121228/176465_1 /TAXON_ID=671091 /ORGANISM="Coscinodiscus wailesii, Strain CCMP2513" /LENGTH=369 /DNA_ID=CAMNT_0013280285 /DNA_START=47 /DNA_END=1156 /DNA_ORIENTATION=+